MSTSLNERHSTPRNSFILNKTASATTEVSTSEPITPRVSSSENSFSIAKGLEPPLEPSPEPESFRHTVFGKVSGLLHKTLTRSRESSISSSDPLHNGNNDEPKPMSVPSQRSSYISPRSSMGARPQTPIKETTRIFLEYDPISKRKVLNTYEILREIGKGEHGKVKLAKDLINNELVAIKILSRKSKKDRPSLRMRNNSKTKINYMNDYEMKIKREIAIMKKCNHKHIVKLREVLDDVSSHKIYLVLEYLEKGEIRWKKSQRADSKHHNPDDIPCCGSNHRRRENLNLHNGHRHSTDNDISEDDLLSNTFTPNLTFKQSRKVFRDVLLGLEYLHLQGIVHRDIKPANLLVSSENIVKISDFGVSFASSLNENDGSLVNELELAKTAGTPAFFAPELCQTNFSASRSSSINGSISATSLEALKNEMSLTKAATKINYKIDIWALGVTLYCLLFGKVPFNADSEYELFLVIVNEKLEFPASRSEFNCPCQISEEEFELAKDLVSKMLDKNPETRIEIKDIKAHPFTLMDLEDNLELLNELLYLNNSTEVGLLDFTINDEERNDIVTKDEIDNAVVGIGARIKKSLVKAIKANGNKDYEVRAKFAALQLEHSRSTSSDESSSSNSNQNSSVKLSGSAGNHSVILSEAFQTSATPNMSRSASHQADSLILNSPHFPSSLSHQKQFASPTVSTASTIMAPATSKSPSFSFAGMREGRNLLLDVIDSPTSSRKGSSAGIAEAPQIETKRNVAGDLYLKNQSIVDTFKEIQQQDDKRRKSSIFSSALSTPVIAARSPLTSQAGVSIEDDIPPHLILSSTQPHVPSSLNGNYSQVSTPISVPVNIKSDSIPTGQNELESANRLKVGPISIDAIRRPSSVMSLPLSESFASLDSINDDYLNLKFQEFTKNRQKYKADNQTSPVIGRLRRPSEAAQSNPDMLKFSNVDDSGNIESINEKFQAFDLASLMKHRAVNFDFSGVSAKKAGSKDSDNEGVAPTSNPARRPSISSSTSSYSSSSNSTESDEEEGNLTLAFSSKVAPLSRPNFLNARNRTKSHESNLPRYINHNATPTYNVPILFQDDLPEFEDLPVGLISNVPRNSISVAQVPSQTASYGTPNLNLSLVSSKSSNTTITPGNYSASPELSPVIEQGGERRPFTIPESDQTIRKPLTVDTSSSQTYRSSPLVNNVSAPIGNTNQDGFKVPESKPQHYHFNNHYKKGPVYSPFPKAKHLDNDKEALANAISEKHINNRPNYYRSNSITVGLLQHRGLSSEADFECE